MTQSVLCSFVSSSSSPFPVSFSSSCWMSSMPPPHRTHHHHLPSNNPIYASLGLDQNKNGYCKTCIVKQYNRWFGGDQIAEMMMVIMLAFNLCIVLDRYLIPSFPHFFDPIASAFPHLFAYLNMSCRIYSQHIMSDKQIRFWQYPVLLPLYVLRAGLTHVWVSVWRTFFHAPYFYHLINKIKPLDLWHCFFRFCGYDLVFSSFEEL